MILRKSTERDLEIFKTSQDDLAEAKAFGLTPSFPDVSECLTVEYQNEPLAIGGNVSNCVWFVTSENIDKLNHKDIKKFIKLITTYRNSLLDLYPLLYNVVWSGNKSHLKFLKFIGATFHKINKHFLLFTIEEDVKYVLGSSYTNCSTRRIHVNQWSTKQPSYSISDRSG